MQVQLPKSVARYLALAALEAEAAQIQRGYSDPGQQVTQAIDIVINYLGHAIRGDQQPQSNK
jgi:hypothetical protein